MFKRLSYQYKLFFTYSIIVLIVVILAIVIFYVNIIGSLEERAIDNITQLNIRSSNDLNSTLSDLNAKSFEIVSNPIIKEVLINISESGPQDDFFVNNPSVASSIKDILLSINGLRPLGKISIISKNYDFLTITTLSQDISPSKSTIRSIKWVKDVMSGEISKQFVPPHTDTWSSDSDINVFSLIRPIRDNYSIFGVLELQQSCDLFSRIFSFKLSSSRIHTLILDAESNIIYSSIPENMDKNIFSYILSQIDSNKRKSGVVKMPEFGSTYIFSYSKLTDFGWTVMLLENESSFSQPIRLMQSLIITFSIIIILITLLIVFFVTRSLTTPIRQLRKSINTIDIATLSFDALPDSTNNEITLLNNVFREMLEQVKNSTNQIIQARSREMKSHLLALQTQVNPHFLYNTLTVIGSYGLESGNFKVTDMCSYLSQMLRYSSDTCERELEMRDEVNHVENYLKLLKLRYQDSLVYSISIDEPLYRISVPKLILEPIIENSMQHAFCNTPQPWVITITGCIRKEHWEIMVEDNGCGFTEEAMKDLESKFKSIKSDLDTGNFSNDLKIGGLGMLNTFARLYIYYAGKETFKYFNNDNGGATIVIGGSVIMRESEGVL